MRWLVQRLRSWVLAPAKSYDDSADSPSDKSRSRREIPIMPPEMVRTTISAQVETHHRIQEQSLALMRLLVAVVGAIIAVVSLLITDLDVGVVIPFREIFLERAQDGLYPNRAFFLVELGLQLIGIGIGLIVGLLGRAIYLLITVLSVPRFQPYIGNEGSASTISEEWVTHNGAELLRIRGRLEICYRNIRQSVLIAAGIGAIVFSLLLGVPSFIPLVVVGTVVLVSIIELVDNQSDLPVGELIEKWGPVFFRIIGLLTILAAVFISINK